MKKFLPFLLVLVLACFGLAACSSSASTETGSADGTSSDAAATTDDSGFKSDIMFCGSTSLYPIMSSLASSFTEDYVTWDKVNADFPEENISIYVAPGGSGVGAQAAIDGTADFGMIARDIKDEEKEALGENYQEFLVAHDALTVSVSKSNPAADTIKDIDTDTLKKIFSGEITKWSEVDSSLPDETINVYIRDLSGGAYEVFQKAVMGDAEITSSATQSASMTELATNVANDQYGIGYVGYGAFQKANADSETLVAISFNGVACDEANILDGSYTIQRPVMFVTGAEVTDSEQAFIDYVFSDTGRQVVKDNGYIPAF